MKNYLKLLRVKHYIKNLLIFAPLVFSRNLTNPPLLLNACLGFLVFCLISSFVYIVNDVRDCEKDRLHSTKCKRPIASGAVSKRSAGVLAAVLLLLAAALCVYLCRVSFWAAVVPLLYVGVNLLYSFGLKNQPVIDVTILALGFVLRLMYGSAVTGIAVSAWLLLTVMALSFYLGLGKRRGELMREQDGTRGVLKAYNKSFLDKNMYLCLGLAIVFYSLWCIDADTVARIGSNALVWTVPLALVICLKYGLDVEGDSDGDPVEVVLGDKVLLCVIALFALAAVGLVYFGKLL